jgi:hypothetical protein
LPRNIRKWIGHAFKSVAAEQGLFGDAGCYGGEDHTGKRDNLVLALPAYQVWNIVRYTGTRETWPARIAGLKVAPAKMPRPQ